MKCHMSKIILKKNKFDDVFKVKFIVFLLIAVVAVSISIPSLARYKNYVNLEAMLNEVQTWDGSVATGYGVGSGSETDPYIISNAPEFAFFVQELQTVDYSGYYFKLGNNIVLNDGLFGYDGTNITYTISGTNFYISPYSSNLYDNKELTGNVISSVNLLDSIKNFSGYFDGDYYTIYGMYLTGDLTELALINTLSGTFSNVHFENSLIYGGSSTAILANNANFAEVSNVSTDGIVVGTGSNFNNSFIVNENDFSVEVGFSLSAEPTYATLNLNVPQGHTYSSIKVKGNAANSGYIDSSAITFGGQTINEGDFEVVLDGNTTSVQGSATGIFTTVDFTNLVSEYVYNYPVASGLVAKANGTNFTNVMNKADVYGTNVSGLVGIATDIAVTSSYNNGNLSGTNASGLVSQFANNSSSALDKTYNNGNLVGTNTNLIGDVINNASLVLGNSFNTVSATSTFDIVTGSVEVMNVYDVNSTAATSGSLTGTVNVLTEEQINKELLVNTLGYAEYVDNDYLVDNPDNIWVYEFEGQPILYVDTLNNPIASLNVAKYSWNDLGYELNTRKFIETKAFNITPLNGNNGFKNVYYYIHMDETPLSRNGIDSIVDWVEYNDIVNLDFEGYFIIYVKVVDQEDRNYYINSDVLFFDLFGPDIKTMLGDVSWNSYNASLDSKYINESVSLFVESKDKYSEVVSTHYYVSDALMTMEELEKHSDWILYEDSILIDQKGPHVINVKSVDSNGHVSYVNSDYVIYGGYSSTLRVGENSDTDVVKAHITSKSSVTYNFVYNDNITYKDGYSTKLVVSEILPENTLITFVDRETNTAYSYVVTADDGVEYPINLFTKVGLITKEYFDDVSFLVNDSKNVSVIFDFKNTTFDADKTFVAYLDLRDSMDNVVLSTLKDNMKETNVYKDLESKLLITNKTVLYGINYDSDSTNVIDFEYYFESLVSGSDVVNDTINENKKTGIAIKLVDSEGNIVDKKYLKNMEFIVSGVNYAANSDGIVRINLSDSLAKVYSNLTIITHENDFDLTDGDYSLVITPFVASDGKFSSVFADSNISIPVVSDYEEILEYDFNVTMDEESKILMKDSGSATISFNIISKNKFDNPSIRVSMYKKYDLSAYNQTYTIIDLAQYASNELELANEMTYNVNVGKFELGLNLDSLDKTGYEVRFELYDGDKKIDTIKKKFIVR